MTTVDSIIRTSYPKGDAIDIYLANPRSLSEFMEAVRVAFESDPDLISRYKTPVDLFVQLLNRYGRFWIDPTETLWYRDRQSRDHPVQKVTITKCPKDECIVRVNGQVVPTVALAQLRRLLTTSDQKWSPLLDQINRHRSCLERSVEEVRPIT